MAFEPELDRLFNRGLYELPPHSPNPLPLSTLADAVRKNYPGTEVGSFGFPHGTDCPFRADISQGVSVYINQYTGEILGEQRGRDLLFYVHQIHIRLLAGKTGKTIMGIAGVIMILILASGLVLWWRYKRFTVKRNAPLFRFMFDLHAASGIYSALFLVLLSTTGVFIAYEDSLLPWLYKATETSPIRRVLPSSPHQGSMRITPEQALSAAKGALRGANPLDIEFPGDSADSYYVRMRFPEDLTPGGRSWACIEQYTGEVLVAQNSRTAPGPTRMEIMVRAIHTGDIFGLTSKVIMSLSSLLVVVQAVSGFVIWWERDGKKGRVLPPG